ncbi:MAG: hypothetical protein WB460_08295 [Candidatus Acidiferrales bacterium]
MSNPVIFPPTQLPDYPTTEVYKPLPGTIELPTPVIPPEPPSPDPPTAPKKD